MDSFPLDFVVRSRALDVYTKQYKEMMDRLGNLQLLSSAENQEKSNQDLSTWLATRNPNFKKRYLIPDDNNLLTFDHFLVFMHARQELIMQRLKQIFLI